MATVHAPLALLPVPYPQQTFLQAKQAAKVFNLMIDRVAQDEQYLTQVLAAAAQYDEFTVGAGRLGREAVRMSIECGGVLRLLLLMGGQALPSAEEACDWSLGISLRQWPLSRPSNIVKCGTEEPSLRPPPLPSHAAQPGACPPHPCLAPFSAGPPAATVPGNSRCAAGAGE